MVGGLVAAAGVPRAVDVVMGRRRTAVVRRAGVVASGLDGADLSRITASSPQFAARLLPFPPDHDRDAEQVADELDDG
jgi:hypothetical protein